MTPSAIAYLVFLSLLGVERIVELTISRRNATWALSHGGVEFGRGHFGAMKVLHSVFFVSCAAEVLLLHRPFTPWVTWPMLGLALSAQGLRYWTIATLGRHWNVRVIVIPKTAAITQGPFRYLRHPNYLAVIIEGIAVPLIHGAWLTALSFTLLNAWLLTIRIRCEENALTRLGNYRTHLGDRARLLPRPPRKIES